MAQTTIYVPDQLWERVKRLRDQEQLNPSAVCQAALQAEVTRLELQDQNERSFSDRARKGSLDLDQLARMIRRHRNDAYQVGYDALIEWARSASYRELVDQQDDVAVSYDGEQYLNPIPPRGEEVAKRLAEEREVRWDQELARPGWRDAVAALWTSIGGRVQVVDAEADPNGPTEPDYDDLPF